MLTSGQELSARFVLVRPLKAGASAVVWQAEDRQQGCFVAVKILAAELAQNLSAIEALQR